MSKTAETKPKTPRPVLVEMVRVHRPNEAACIKALQIALDRKSVV